MKNDHRRSVEYLTAKFWSRVEKGSECWMWTGRVERDGYGIAYWLGAERRVHRLSYELAHGYIPEGMTVDHLCFTRACVNPEHLRAVPHAINAARQRRAQATHCHQGHEYTPQNTYQRPAGGRQCRACQAEVARRYRERKAS